MGMWSALAGLGVGALRAAIARGQPREHHRPLDPERDDQSDPAGARSSRSPRPRAPPSPACRCCHAYLPSSIRRETGGATTEPRALVPHPHGEGNLSIRQTFCNIQMATWQRCGIGGRCFAKAPKASAQLVSARPRSPPRHARAISPCAKASVSTRATSSRATCCMARVDTAARRSPRQTSRFPSSLASIPTPRPRGSLGCHLHVARRCHRETYRSRPYTDHVARSRSNDRTTADRFRTAALAAGGKDRGAPGQRPYRPGHHATFVLDPDRSNIAGVHHNRSNRAVDAADAIKITFRPGRGAAMALSHHPCAPYGRSGDPPARRFHRS